MLVEEEQLFCCQRFFLFLKSQTDFSVPRWEMDHLLSSCCSFSKETLRLMSRWDIRRSGTNSKDMKCICHCRWPMLLPGMLRLMIYLVEKQLRRLGLERSELCHLRLYVLEDVDTRADCKAWRVDRQTDKNCRKKVMSHTYTSLKATARRTEGQADGKINVNWLLLSYISHLHCF